MPWPKKNSYKEFYIEKRFLRLENSLPQAAPPPPPPPPSPITFLIVRPLSLCLLLFSVVHENRMREYLNKMPRVSDEDGVLEVKCKRK